MSDEAAMRDAAIPGFAPVGNRAGTALLQAALMARVMACTHELVNQALRADWSRVLDGMGARRRLLQCVIDHDFGYCSPQVAALSTAVEESERALMRVIAHAIASSRRRNAMHAMYH